MRSPADDPPLGFHDARYACAHDDGAVAVFLDLLRLVERPLAQEPSDLRADAYCDVHEIGAPDSHGMSEQLRFVAIIVTFARLFEVMGKQDARQFESPPSTSCDVPTDEIKVLVHEP